VCSIQESRLARVGEAIDEIDAAVHAATPAAPDMDDLAERVATIWAMVAELDPALALRMPGYYQGSPGDRSRAGEEPASG
jgi:hypothetical protein